MMGLCSLNQMFILPHKLFHFLKYLEYWKLGSWKLEQEHPVTQCSTGQSKRKLWLNDNNISSNGQDLMKYTVKTATPLWLEPESFWKEALGRASSQLCISLLPDQSLASFYLISSKRVFRIHHGVWWMRTQVPIVTFLMFCFSPVILYVALVSLTLKTTCSFLCNFFA